MGERIVPFELPASDAAHEIQRRIGDRLPTRSALLQVRPLYYRVPEDENHGLEHAGLVLAPALVLGELINHERIQGGFEPIFADDDFQALSLAAAYHDSHSSGNIDGYAEHGIRAAAWVRKHLQGVYPQPVIFSAAYLIYHHVPDDDPLTMTDLLATFKDVDGGARVRFGNKPWGLNADYLRHDISRQFLVGPMRAAYDAATSLRSKISDGFTRAIEANVQAGFVLDR